MSKLACVFPGQGAQTVGMGSDLFNSHPEAREIFERIDEIAGRKLSQLSFDGPEEELKRTINTQPTILAVSIASWQSYLKAGGPRPQFVAGHSLGEFTSLYAASVLSLESVVKLVDKRSRLMEECPKGAMSAVIGMAAERLEHLCHEAGQEIGSQEKSMEHVVIVANFNTREQLVISGSPRAVDLAGGKAKAEGAKVIPLSVGGAFHSPLMEEAAFEFEKLIGEVDFARAEVPVIQNFDARPAIESDELKSKLARQMPNSVRWCETIEYMLSQGVDTFVEIGPGKALAGMVKKIDRKASVFNVFDSASLTETIKGLNQVHAV